MTNQEFIGHYRITRPIGEGGFGTTYLVEDTHIHLPAERHRIIKQLKPFNENLETNEIIKERFKKEAQIIEELGKGHSQIPVLYAYFEQEGNFYLVEEYIEGKTLEQLVNEQGKLSSERVEHILTQLVEVLEYLQRKRIIHRDIKPENIILRDSDHLPILIDFGAIKESINTTVTESGRTTRSIIIGTPGFMPPEQSIGRPVFASDIYALGLTGIYLLTGKRPEELENDPLTGEILWQEHASDVNPELANILNRAIRSHVKERFLTAEKMANALKNPAIPVETQVSLAPPLSSASKVVNSAPLVVSSPSRWLKPLLLSMAGVFVASTALAGRFLYINAWNNQKTHESDSIEESFETTPTPLEDPYIDQPTQQLKSENERLQELEALRQENKRLKQQNSPISSIYSSNLSASMADASTDATIVGEAGSKNIRRGPGLSYGVRHIAYPDDRVKILQKQINNDNFPWYEIYFPKTQAKGWIAGNLLKVDGQQSYQSPSQSVSQSRTNAIISGTAGVKNVRSGAGTNYSVVGQLSTGRRVQIMGSGYDNGGYLWYHIHYPESGLDGWIGAQLVSRD